MMSEKVNSILHNDQLEKGPFPSQESQSNKRELTDDEKIDLTAARILETYREAFQELSK